MNEVCDPYCRMCHPTPVHCAKCQQLIPRDAIFGGNLDGGLLLTVDGWYGGTVDPFNDHSAYLCDGCAREFLTANSWLGALNRELTAPPPKS